MPAAGNRSMVVVAHASRAPALAPLVERLASTTDLRTADGPGVLNHLAGVDAVFIDWPAPVDESAAAALERFVSSGGTAILAGATLASWSGEPPIGSMAAWSPDGMSLETELRFQAVDGAAFTTHDTVHLLRDVPPNASSLLHAAYHHARHVAAYERTWGTGRFVYLGVGRGDAAYAEPEMHALVVRALRGEAAPTVRIGMLGFGALGPAHAAAIATVPGLQLDVVCDVTPARRELAAEAGILAVADEQDLLRSDIDVVFIGTPPVQHASAALRALAADKHVVCEKPFALTVAECDAVVTAAQRSSRMVSVVQNRRWDPDFVRLRDVIRAGHIGEVFHMESFVGGHAHPCNYWHSEESISGGAVYDWGSHHIDWLLQVVEGPVRQVRCVSQKRVWHDVTNADHLTVEMHFASGAQAFFTHSELAAARKPKWYVLGTAGAVVGAWQETVLPQRGIDREIDVDIAAPADTPARLTVHRPTAHGGADIETLSLPPRDRAGYWRSVAAHLRDGAPLAVTPQEARRTVAVLEAAVSSAANDGALVTLDV